MKSPLGRLASLRLTFAGMVSLLVATIVVERADGIDHSWLALPLALLGINLFAAIVTNRVFRRQAGLLLFHLGLLGVLVIAGAGLLMRLDARVEIVEGEHFDPARVDVVSRGWLYPGSLASADFRQGQIEVDYVGGLTRGQTRSQVLPAGTDAPILIGDRQGLVAGDHRFQATFNKGYSLLLAWHGEDRGTMLAAVNLPSYPEYEWKQRNDWLSPFGERVEIELRLRDRVPAQASWMLSSRNVAYSVEIRHPDGATTRLDEGESVQLRGGRLRVADLRLWMGYRIDYNPLLPWVLSASLLTLLALGIHYVDKFLPGARLREQADVDGRQLA